MSNPRQTAAQALIRVEGRNAWSNITLDSLLRAGDLDARDSALAGALFYGVLERRITLDACIAAHCKMPLAKLSPPVRQCLRLGLYQLLYMDSIPEHAAVGENVELVKKMGQSKASGLVNGVLRAFLRGGKAVPLPGGPVEERWAVEYSCPAPLIRLWMDGYGEEEARRILESGLGKPPLYIRANPLKTTPDQLAASLEQRGVAARRDGDLEHCLVLERPGAVQELPQYREGLFHVQDKASQLCALSLEAKPGERVLDACAAPGGKTFTLAQEMGNRGELVACDLHAKRAGLVARRAQEMGLDCVRALARDMSKPDPAAGEESGLGLFDRVLCDVPCSGLGAIRRRPEIKYKSLEQFEKLPEIQYKILETASHYCKEGGRLVYSTCTLNPAENSAVAARFLEEHREFRPAALPPPLDGTERTILDEFGADGFFLAAFERVAAFERAGDSRGIGYFGLRPGLPDPLKEWEQ